MIARAKLHFCGDFRKQGFPIDLPGKEKDYKMVFFCIREPLKYEFLDAEGRLYVDLLPLVKRDFKFNNYRLKTISEHFIGETKDPLSVKGIFKCYRIGMKKDSNGVYSKSRHAMGIVGKYCVQDSTLVVQLMEKLQTWIGLTPRWQKRVEFQSFRFSHRATNQSIQSIV